MKISKLLPLSLFAFALFYGCNSEPSIIPNPEPEGTSNINLTNPMFQGEDSCRSFPLPSAGPLMEYNEFPDKHFTRTIAHNPDNPCEFLASVSNTSSWALIDVCAGTKSDFNIFPSGGPAGKPVWGRNEWMIFSYKHEIWKIKSNGDSLALIIPNPNAEYYSPLRWDPLNDEFFFFNYQHTTFRVNINNHQVDTLGTDFRMAEVESKTLFSDDESIGYYDLDQNTYVSVSNKYDRNFGGVWLPDGEHFIWLVMENGGSYPISLVEFNIHTQQERLIKEWSCYNRTYTHPRISSDGKWVYMRLTYAEHLGGRDMFADWFTAFVNVDTGEEYWSAFEPD